MLVAFRDMLNRIFSTRRSINKVGSRVMYSESKQHKHGFLYDSAVDIFEFKFDVGRKYGVNFDVIRHIIIPWESDNLKGLNDYFFCVSVMEIVAIGIGIKIMKFYWLLCFVIVNWYIGIFLTIREFLFWIHADL